MTLLQHDYRDQERARAAAWKQRTPTLPEPAREPAPYVNKAGKPRGAPLPFCLPPAHAPLNLLPEVREPVLALFDELGIPWHASVQGGPSNHLLSSQVQCANALGQMVGDPVRLQRAFGGVLDVAEVTEVEPGRALTFELIGPTDFFGESPDRERVRGSRCTSVDAAFAFRTSTGARELALVEWTYVEDHRQRRRPEPAQDAVRSLRYLAAVQDPDGPVRDDVIRFQDLLDEPFYQLVRQQLLAHALERAGVADVVRVVHVLSPRNTAYQESLTRLDHHSAGRTVSQAWAALLRRPDRFVTLDPDVFLDPEITSGDYADRYGDLRA